MIVTESLKWGAGLGAAVGFVANRFTTGDTAPYLTTEIWTASLVGAIFRYKLDNVLNQPKDMPLWVRNGITLAAPTFTRIAGGQIGLELFSETVNNCIYYIPHVAASLFTLFLVSQCKCKASATRVARKILLDPNRSLNQKANSLGEIAKNAAISRFENDKSLTKHQIDTTAEEIERQVKEVVLDKAVGDQATIDRIREIEEMDPLETPAAPPSPLDELDMGEEEKKDPPEEKYGANANLNNASEAAASGDSSSTPSSSPPPERRPHHYESFLRHKFHPRAQALT